MKKERKVYYNKNMSFITKLICFLGIVFSLNSQAQKICSIEKEMRQRKLFYKSTLENSKEFKIYRNYIYISKLKTDRPLQENEVCLEKKKIEHNIYKTDFRYHFEVIKSFSHKCVLAERPVYSITITNISNQNEIVLPSQYEAQSIARENVKKLEEAGACIALNL